IFPYTSLLRSFVRDRIHQKSKGHKVIEQELAKKGIKKETIKQALEQYTFDKQYDRALKWLQKERRKKAKHAHKKQEEQLKIKLLQKGFQDRKSTRLNSSDVS